MINTVANYELVERLHRQDSLLLIDVREESEYAYQHIPQSLWVPLDELGQYCRYWPKDMPIVVICNTVNRSAAACRYLAEQGFSNVCYAVPGMADWQGPLSHKCEASRDGITFDRSIYLDNAATTPVYPEVASVVWWCQTQGMGNPSSAHRLGRCGKEYVIKARKQVASLLGAVDKEIYFTSGGTESDNAALWGIMTALPRKRRRVVTSAVEHKAILANLEALQRAGYEVTILPVNDHGLVDPNRLKAVMDYDVGLVSIMAANNEIGTIQPIKQLVQISHGWGAYFHSDAVQAAGYLPLDVNRLQLDALSISGHKIGGPKGIGALYIRSRTPFEPLIKGGGQERGYRSGTENVPGIVGLGVACRITQGKLAEAPVLARMRDYLEARLRKISGVKIFGHPKKRLPNNLCFCAPGKDGYGLVLDLDLRGVACSSGSACSGSKHSSHVLKALGLVDSDAKRAIRLSLGWQNTWDEIYRAGDILVHLLTEEKGHKGSSNTSSHYRSDGDSPKEGYAHHNTNENSGNHLRLNGDQT